MSVEMEIRPGVLRTPDSRFEGLPNFPFAPHYIEVPGGELGPLRMHYLDEGPRDGRIVLMLHGNPTWSYLYRHMIGPVVDAGYRVVVPDLIGFGRSDKPAARADHSYDRAVGWVHAFLDTLDLRDVTLVIQDWGGLIGLRLIVEQPDRFVAVLAANTLLPNYEPPPNGVAGWPGEHIEPWIEYCRTQEDLAVPEMVQGASVKLLSEDALAGYAAPFPDARFKKALLQMTCCVPGNDDSNGLAVSRETWRKLEGWNKPFLTAFSDGDLATIPWIEVFHRRIPGTKGQDHTTIEGAGHFLQEERGPELAKVLVEFMAKLP